MESDDRERRMLLAQALDELRQLFEDHRHFQTDQSLRLGHVLYMLRLNCDDASTWSADIKEMHVAPATARKRIDLVRLFLGAPRLYQNLRHLSLEVLYRIARLGPVGAAKACPEAAVDGVEFDDAQRCIDPPEPAVLLPSDENRPPPNGTAEELRTLLADYNRKRTHTVDLCVQRGRMLSEMVVELPAQVDSLGLSRETAARAVVLGLFATEAPKLTYALRTRVATIGELYALVQHGPEAVARLHPDAAAEASAMEDREVERWRGAG